MREINNINDLLSAVNNLEPGAGMRGRGRAAPEASPAAGPDLPAQPSRDDVRRALSAVSSRVASCGGGTRGTAIADIVFAGNGSVKTVSVSGVPANVKSCVERGVRGARVPRFSRETFPVRYPFPVR